MAGTSTNFVMIGNPGVGKSTVLNALVGEVKFESGLSFGSGLTTICQRHLGKHGMVYIDTPGLSDIDMREKAAQEITAALMSGGFFRIFFVITLEGGRARPDDLTTMKLVLKAATQIGHDYSIIVNKMDKVMYAALNKGNNREKIEAALNKDLPGTSSIYYNLEVEELKSRDNVIHQLPPELAIFIASSPLVAITKEQVTPIKSDEFEQMKKEFAAVIQKMNDSIEYLTKSLEEERKRSDEIRKQNDQKMQDLQKEHNKALKEMLKEQAKELKRISDDNKNKIPLAPPPAQAPSTSTSPASPSPALSTSASPQPQSSNNSSSGFGSFVGGVVGFAANLVAPGAGPYVGEVVKSWF